MGAPAQHGGAAGSSRAGSGVSSSNIRSWDGSDPGYHGPLWPNSVCRREVQGECEAVISLSRDTTALARTVMPVAIVSNRST